MLVCCLIEFLKVEWGCLPSFAGSRKASRVRAMIKVFGAMLYRSMTIGFLYNYTVPHVLTTIETLLQGKL